jgi:hypothetical protein
MAGAANAGAVMADAKILINDGCAHPGVFFVAEGFESAGRTGVCAFQAEIAGTVFGNDMGRSIEASVPGGK